MRLKTLEENLTVGLDMLSKLDKDISEMGEDSTNVRTVKVEIDKITTIIEILSKEFPVFLPLYTFENELMEIKYQLHRMDNDPFLDNNELKKFQNIIEKKLSDIQKTFKNKAEIIKNLKVTHHINDTSYVYAIGLPTVTYFDELSDFTKDLNFVFKTIVGEKEKAKLVGFDVGSEWYLIGFDTYIAFQAFGLFTNECYKYLKRKKEDKNRLTELNIKDEQQLQLEEAMSVANQIFIQDGLNKINRLKNEEGELTPEEMTRNLKALEIFSSLLEKKMKVDIDKQPENCEKHPPLKLPSSDKIRNLLESATTLLLDEGE